jgi:hypothetical protein
MSATQQPYGSVPSSTHDEADEWQSALTRARRDTYEGPDPQGEDDSDRTAPGVNNFPGTLVDGPGHALRAHEQANWAQPQFATSAVKTKSPASAILVTALVVGAAATMGLLWMHQDHSRLMSAKDQQLERLENQKSTAQEARAQAENDLANDRERFAAQLEAMRLERNAALNAASPASRGSAQQDVVPAAKPVAAQANLPKFPGKKDVSNDPLGGLADAPQQTKGKRK